MTARPAWVTGLTAVVSVITLLNGAFRLLPPATGESRAPTGAFARTDWYAADPFTISASTVTGLRAHGLTPTCRLRVGVWEPGRPDAGRFPPDVIGGPAPTVVGTLPDQTPRWLDLRRWDALGPIVTDRVALCRAKGFREVILTDLDGYAYPTGFSLGRTDADHFSQLVIEVAHTQGLAAQVG